jgi:hypothetical protein
MPEKNTPESLLIRDQELRARPSKPPPDRRWPASQFHDPTRAPQVRVPPHKPIPMPSLTAARPGLQPPPTQPTLTARGALKVSVVLDPASLLGPEVPNGRPRLVLGIRLADARTLTADLSAKSVRRAMVAIRARGADAIIAILQGHLVADTIAEAGLSAQPKAAKAQQTK